MLDEMLAMNSDAFAGPPTEFRKGHVTAASLAATAHHETPRGFRIDLPSHAPVATPAVYDGKVFVSGGFRSRTFYAVDAKSGALAWGITLDDDGPSSPACDDDVCVFNTESCTVFAVEADSGEMLWSWWLGDPLMSAPAVADGRVFVSYPAAVAGHVRSSAPSPAGKTRPPGATHVLAAFDLRSGKIEWQRWIDADVMSAPVASGGDVYATTFAGTVVRFSQADGTIKSARRARATSAPVIARGSVYYTRRTDAGSGGGSGAAEGVVAQDGEMQQQYYSAATRKAPWLDKSVQQGSKMYRQGLAHDAANGFGGGAPPSAQAATAQKLVGRASVSTLQAFQGSRLLALGGANINTMGDAVVSTDARTGDERWSIKLDGDLAKQGGSLGAAPAAAGGDVFVGTVGGQVLQIDAERGRVRRRFSVGAPVRSQPVIMDGWIYVGTDDGKLVAIDTRDPSVTGWSHWGGNAARTGEG